MSHDRKPGATGRFPQGKIHPADDGELQIVVAAVHSQGVVLVNFGTPTLWLGLPSTEARALAALLVEKADELDARKS